MSALSKVADEVIEGVVKTTKAVPTPGARAITASERAASQKAVDDILNTHNAKVQDIQPEQGGTGSWEDYFDSSINPNKKPESGRFRKQVEDDPEGIMANIWGQRGAARAQGEEGFIRRVEAESRLNQGENEATVFADTGWYRGQDGKMKLHASERHIKVNTDKMFNKIMARHQQTPYNDGQEFAMRVNLGDFLDSERLFKAYPELADTDVVIHFKYMGKNEDGKDLFGIYNSERAERGVLGAATYPSTSVPTGRINIYNTVNDTFGNDQGRSTLLHEVQHMIQRVEGFSEGASSTQLRNMAEAAADVRIDRHLLDALEEGKVYSGMPKTERDALVMEMITKFGDELDEAGMAYKYYNKAIDRAIGKEWSDLHVERMDLETAWAGFIDDAVLALKMNDQTYDDIAKLLNEGKFSDLWDQAFAVYSTSGGEVESRLVQLFDGMREQEFRRLTAAQGRTTEDYVDVINNPVRGGKEGIITGRGGAGAEEQRPRGSEGIFGTQRNTVLTNRNRGGTDGGGLDTGIPTDEWKTNPEGTQQQGTLEELFESSTGKPLDTGFQPPKFIDDMNTLEKRRAEDSYFREQRDRIREEYADADDNEVRERAIDALRRWQDNDEAMKQYKHGINRLTINALHGTQGPKEIDFLKNPTKTQLKKWAKKNLKVDDEDYSAIRVITDVQGNYYIWDANEALHDDVIKATGLRMNLDDDWNDVDGVEPDQFDDLFKWLGLEEGEAQALGIDVASPPHPRKQTPEAERLLALEEKLDEIEYGGKGSIDDRLDIEDEMWDIIDRTGLLEEEGWQQTGWILSKKDGWETLTLPDGTELDRKIQ